MAITITETPQILGQAAPAANTLTALYTVPATNTTAVANVLIINNPTAGQITYKISQARSASADSPIQYIAGSQSNGMPLTALNIIDFQLGLGLNAGDQIRVWTDTAGVVFNLNGIQRVTVTS